MQRWNQPSFSFGRAACAVFAIALSLGVAAAAGDGPSAAPPLPGALFDTEKQMIQRENDPKDHVETCLKVGAIRLSQAFDATRRQEYVNAAKTLTVYDQLLSYTHGYAKTVIVKGKKRDQLYRLIETTLRRQTPTLEVIAQETPSNHEENARAALNRAREIRRVTLNAVFGGEFFKDEPSASAAAAGGGTAPLERKPND
jgi:hypothetical protein